MSENFILNILPIRFIPFDLGTPIKRNDELIRHYVSQHRHLRLANPSRVEQLITPDIICQFQAWPHPHRHEVKMVFNLFADGYGIVTLFDERIIFERGNDLHLLWKLQRDIHESLFNFSHELHSPVLEEHLGELRIIGRKIANHNRIPMRVSASKNWETNGLRYINTVLFIQDNEPVRNDVGTNNEIVRQFLGSSFLSNTYPEERRGYCRIAAWESTIIIGNYSDDDFAKQLHLQRKLERARFFIYTLRRDAELVISLISKQNFFSNSDGALAHDFHLQTRIKVSELKEIGVHRLLGSEYYDLFQPLLKANRIFEEIDKLEELLQLIEEHLLVHITRLDANFQRATTLTLLAIAAIQVIDIANQQVSFIGSILFLLTALAVVIWIILYIFQLYTRRGQLKILSQRKINVK
jgi:hypothetical protein